ncbi:MAG TPA: energy transducer TonB [Flavobacterium sp.]|nr:energy transducer TonB [Flavobacterium sp.]
MKKLVLLLFFVSTFGFSQEIEYSKIFANFDSIQKKSLPSHINRVISLINYEFVKEKRDSSKYSEITVRLDSIGRLNLRVIDKKNNDLENFFEDIFQKIPLIEITDEDNKNVINKFITIKFTLHKNINLESWSESITGNIKDSIKNMKELDIYPSFGKFKKNYDKEKSLKDFNKKISKHIIDNFKYPELAIQNNITGETLIYFEIENDGSIEKIIIIGAHPILHYAGIEIITKLPIFHPGYINKEPVRVGYYLPLTFKLK